MDRARCGAAGRARSRGNGGRGHRGQYRHRLGACVQRSGLSVCHRHAGQPSRREIPDCRGPGGGVAQGARRTVQRPQSVPESRGTFGREIAECGLGEPVRQHGQPRGPHRIDGPGNLARHPRQDRCLLCGDGDRRYARRRCNFPQVAIRLGPHRARRSSGQRVVSLHHGRRAQIGRRLLDHRGDRHRARDGEPRGRADRRGNPHPDAETLRFVYRLLREEGLFVGSTAGINVAAAVSIAKRIGPGHTIVTVLCDGGAKYQSRLFNPTWISERGFADAIG